VSWLAKKIDILKHKLVPPHRILSENEVKSLLDKLNISPVQLPTIKLKDPVIIQLNAKENDIIEIIRENPTGQNKFFRRVIN